MCFSLFLLAVPVSVASVLLVVAVRGRSRVLGLGAGPRLWLLLRPGLLLLLRVILLFGHGPHLLLRYRLWHGLRLRAVLLLGNRPHLLLGNGL